MFDVSFSELIVIVVVALVVIGPEKLPKVARTLGAMSGRMQRYIAQVKEEVNREVRFEELQTLQSEIKSGADKAQRNVRSAMLEMESTMNIDEVIQKPEQSLEKNVQLLDENQTDLKKLVKKRIKKPTKSVE